MRNGPTSTSIETQVLKDREGALRGEPDAVERLCDALMEVNDRHRSLVPVLRELLDSGNPTLMVYGASALARLKIGAAAAVPQLIELAQYGDGAPREAAVAALGEIPGPATLECLVGLFESSDFEFNIHHVAPALVARSDEWAPVLRRIERGLAYFTGDEHAVLKMKLTEPDPWATGLAPTLRVPSSEPYVRILPAARQFQPPAEYFADYAQALPDQTGLVCEGRFRFDAGSKSEVGLRISRTSRSLPDRIVVFSADADSFGEKPDGVLIHLATAAVHIFGLNPATTAWIVHESSRGPSESIFKDSATLYNLTLNRERSMYVRRAEGDPTTFGLLLGELGGHR